MRSRSHVRALLREEGADETLPWGDENPQRSKAVRRKFRKLKRRAERQGLTVDGGASQWEIAIRRWERWADNVLGRFPPAPR